MSKKQNDTTQFELPLFHATSAPAVLPERRALPAKSARSVPAPVAPAAGPGSLRGLRVLQGGGERKHEQLASRDAVVRVLLEAGADLLLRRISSERAEEIERKVDRILRLFDQVDETPILMSVLKRQLDDLEALMRETRDVRKMRAQR